MEKTALAGYLAGTGLAGAAGIAYLMDKEAGETSPLTETLDEIVKEASVNVKKAELTSQLLLREIPKAFDIPRENLLKAACYVEAVHGDEPLDNKVAILADMVKRANETQETSYQEDLEKEAALPPGLMSYGMGLGRVVGAGLALSGAAAAAGAVNNSLKYKKFEAVFQFVVKHSPVLQHEYEQNPKKVRSFAETIFTFAPDVALDPNLLTTVLGNAAMGESMDPQTIKAVLELQKLHSGHTGTHLSHLDAAKNTISFKGMD